MLNIDFAAVRAGKATLPEQLRGVTIADLQQETDKAFQTIHSIIDSATDTDVIFVPDDPKASDGSGKGWTLGHVLAHITALIEEGAVTASLLARGLSTEKRLIAETPWEQLNTSAKVQARIAESQRVCRAYLNAWPDTPDLETTITFIPALGPMNATARYALGVFHASTHIEQLQETVRQAQAVRA